MQIRHMIMQCWMITILWLDMIQFFHFWQRIWLIPMNIVEALLYFILNALEFLVELFYEGSCLLLIRWHRNLKYILWLKLWLLRLVKLNEFHGWLWLSLQRRFSWLFFVDNIGNLRWAFTIRISLQLKIGCV